MTAMDTDWTRLSNAIRDARNALQMTQDDLARHAGISVATIKNLEGGRGFVRWPKTMGKVELALDKPEGWARAQALGQGDAPPRARSPIRRLPAGVQAALDEGETLAADVIDLSRPGSPFQIIVVAQVGVYQTPDDIERLRDQMEEWFRVQRALRELTSDGASGSDS
jgi:transcriptional regulator with XRE-family HTH domain